MPHNKKSHFEVTLDSKWDNTNKTNNIGAIFTNGSYGISNKLNYVITVFKSRTKVSFYI